MLPCYNHRMPKNHVYFEENRFCEESNCKYLKRMVVGLVRFIESTSQDANIPEHYFDDVPDNAGFEYEFCENKEDGEDVRCFALTNDWKPGDDDCGGEEHDHDEIDFFPIEEKNNVIHLRLVKDGE